MKQTLSDGSTLTGMSESINHPTREIKQWEPVFHPDEHYYHFDREVEGNPKTVGINGAGHAKEVFGHVIGHVRDILHSKTPPVLYFSSRSDEPSRGRFYDWLTSRVSRIHPDYSAVKTVSKGMTEYGLVHKDAMNDLIDAHDPRPVKSKNGKIERRNQMLNDKATRLEQLRNIIRANTGTDMYTPDPESVHKLILSTAGYHSPEDQRMVEERMHYYSDNPVTEEPFALTVHPKSHRVVVIPGKSQGQLRHMGISSGFDHMVEGSHGYGLAYSTPRPGEYVAEFYDAHKQHPEHDVRPSTIYGRSYARYSETRHPTLEEAKKHLRNKVFGIEDEPKSQNARGTDTAVIGSLSTNNDVRVQIAHRILKDAQVRGRIRPAVFIGPDSRASTLQSIHHNNEPDAVRYIASWYGLMAKEPRLTVFHVDPQGNDRLHVLTSDLTPDKVQEAARNIGIPNLVQSSNQYHVFDDNGSMTPNIKQLASNINARHSAFSGTGHRIGSGTGSDSHARTAYRSIIKSYEADGNPERPPEVAG